MKYKLFNTHTMEITKEAGLDDKTKTILNYAYGLNNSPLRWILESKIKKIIAANED